MDADRIRELCEGHAHLPPLIAAHIARRLPDHVTAAELEPTAWEALHTAAATHDPGRGRFDAWARLRITGAILDELRGMDPQTKKWRPRQRALEHARDVLTVRLRRAPTRAELQAEAGLTAHEHDRHERAAVQLLSIDHESAGLGWLRDPTPTADETAAEHPDLAGWVRAAVIALPDRQRGIIRGLYWGGQTTTAIAGVLGVHRSRVSQIHAVAVGMIRDALAWHLDSDPGPALSARSARRRDAYRHAVAHAHDLHRD